jgi:hypothetical protein
MGTKMTAKEGAEKFRDERTGNDLSVRGLINGWVQGGREYRETLGHLSPKDRMGVERTIRWMQANPKLAAVINYELSIAADTERLIRRAVAEGACPISLLVDQAAAAVPARPAFKFQGSSPGGKK